MKIGSSHGVSLPSQSARAVGLVRKLEDGTFKGASIDKLREKFAHRLIVENATTETVENPDETSVAPGETGQIIDVLA